MCKLCLTILLRTGKKTEVFSGKEWRSSGLKCERSTEECFLSYELELEKIGKTCSTLWANEKRLHFVCKLEGMIAARRR